MAHARLALPAAVAWAVLAVLIGLPAALPWVTAAAWVLAGVAVLGALLVAPSRTRLVLLATVLCAASAALMLGSAVAGGGARHPATLVDAAQAGTIVRATATVTQTVHEGAPRFRATLLHGTAGESQFSGSVPVLVFGSVAEGAAIGAQVTVTGTLTATEAGQSEGFLLFARDRVELVSGPPWYLRWAHNLRMRLLDAATALPGDGGTLLPGLAVGDTSAVDEGLDQAMKGSSLSHLTAVSGANCAVVIALVMMATAAMGLSRGWRIALSLIVLLGFVVLVTPEPSVLRAAVMAALVLGAIASGRPVRGLPVLSLAVLALLVFDPWLARSYGFVLSVCATAGLLVLAGPLARKLSKWVPYPLALVIAVPAAAQLACQPVLILLSPTLPTYGVIANVLAGPAAPVATVLGLAACVILPVVPIVGQALALLAWLPSAWIAAVAGFFTNLPGAQLPWPADGWGALLAAFILVLGLVGVLANGARAALWRSATASILALACACYLGVAVGEQVRARVAAPSDWVIAACDVGQGDAVLMRSAGKIALIDAGPTPEALNECLTTLGVGHIDLLVLTHFDLDHVGGSEAVAGRTDRLLVGPSSGADDDRLVQGLADAGAQVDQVSPGYTGVLGDLRWSVLWPPDPLGWVETGNPASVVLLFEGVGECAEACPRSLFLGDLGEEAQNGMLRAGPVGAVDVVKVAHHGSRDQSARLYENIQATVGIIGVGVGNSYGHPTDDILNVLGSTETVVARTDLHGLVLLSVRQGEFSLWSEHGTIGGAE